MGDARIDGRPVALEAAIAEAARLLGTSRLPVIAGLGTDIAGARAAIALADRIGGVVDHMHGDALLRGIAVMRESGTYVTTPNEARVRGDTLLLVGPGVIEAWPAIGERLLLQLLADGAKRKIFWLCPGKADSTLSAVTTIGRSQRELPTLLAVLRAQIAGRPAGKVAKPVAELAKALQAVRFGVAVWAPALDELAIEMLFGVIDDLNATTRFSALPLPPGDNAVGLLQTCGWMTGFPMRTGFGRRYPEHDPWRFDARRLVESGEADCALWISAYRSSAPGWDRAVPIVALANDAHSDQHVYIQVGRPGTDHDAVAHDETIGTLAAKTVGHKSDLPSVAHVIAQIAAALPERGQWPC